MKSHYKPYYTNYIETLNFLLHHKYTSAAQKLHFMITDKILLICNTSNSPGHPFEIPAMLDV